MSYNNGNNNQRRVVEDAPQMRSVRIGSAAPAMQAPPPMPFGRTTLAPTKIAPTNQINTATSVDKGWKISPLRPVPSFYKLERTHLKINDASPEQIAARIADCLRQESVYATFNDEEASIESETHEGVTFTTQMFQGDNKVIVELQRQAGCCHLFHQTARTVLRAAKGMQQVQRRTLELPKTVPKCDLGKEKESLENGLELAQGLLKKDRLDARMLAMQSLGHLSLSAKCECLVAKAILCGPLLKTMVSLIECWSINDAVNEEEKGEIEQQHGAAMHRLAIGVLANCLSVLETEGELQSVLVERREQLCSPSLLMALVEELRRAEQRPHDAAEAARCLQPLLRNCAECKPRILECDGFNAAALAHDAGKSIHANLQKECHLLKIEIGNCN